MYYELFWQKKNKLIHCGCYTYCRSAHVRVAATYIYLNAGSEDKRQSDNVRVNFIQIVIKDDASQEVNTLMLDSSLGVFTSSEKCRRCICGGAYTPYGAEFS